PVAIAGFGQRLRELGQDLALRRVVAELNLQRIAARRGAAGRRPDEELVRAEHGEGRAESAARAEPRVLRCPIALLPDPPDLADTGRAADALRDPGKRHG